MGMLDKMIEDNAGKSFGAAPEETKPEENTTPQETPQETPPADENKGGGTEDTPPAEKGAEGPETQKNEDVPPADDKKPPKDTSQFTKEEKAEFAFKRQLAKQASKYEGIITQMNEKFDGFAKQFEDFKKANAKPAELKTREDFPADKGGDDAYIRYLVQTQNEEYRAEQESKQAEEASKKAEEDKATKEQEEITRQQTENFSRNCRQAFQGDAYNEFQGKVQKAVDNGLGEILDAAPVVRDYIFNRADGPAILNAMLSDKNTFVRIMSLGNSPTEAIIEMHDLARELRNPPKQEEQKQEPPKGMPKLGKPGSQGTAPTGKMSPKELLAFVHNCR